MAARLIVLGLVTSILIAEAPARGEDFTCETAIAVRSASQRLNLARTSPGIDSALEVPLARLELVTQARGSVSWGTLGRMQHTLFVSTGRPRGISASADLDTLMSYITRVLIPQYEARFGAAASDSLFAPFDSLVKHRHESALERNEEALRRYELKYGPGSARLNLLEMAVNHFLQGFPTFGPGRLGPGPFELLAGYSTSYATVGDARATTVSVLEAGLRWYFFAGGWGEERGWSSYLRPRYAALGVAVAGAQDGPFRLPGGPGHPRVGPFVSWGGIKFAYLGGREQRFMISRQMHWIPNLF